MSVSSASEQWTTPIIDQALHSLIQDAVVPRSPWVAREAIAQAAKRAYDVGRLHGVMELRTCTELAAEFGVDRTTVFRWACQRGIGWRIGRDLLFRPEDVERLKLRV